MNVLKTSSIFRPTSRPTSPSSYPNTQSDTNIALDRTPRKLSLGTFRRPALVTTPSPAAVPMPIVQDGSYLEMLSLKLNEAASRSLSHPTGPIAANEQLGGKQPIPAGRGKALGALIESELNATVDNPHLRRATLRCMHRPLSVLVTNLSAQLLHLLSSPAFHLPPSSAPHSAFPNPTQIHALGLASFAGELLEKFDCLGLGIDSDPRGDGLKTVRDGLASVVNRVVNPLVGGIRNELLPLIEALENPITTTQKPPQSSKCPNQHPSIVALHAVIPHYGRLLSRYTATPASQTVLATFFICLVWRGLVALSHRHHPPPSPPPSPGRTYTWNKKRHTSPPALSPLSTLPGSKFTISGPPTRPMSPLSLQVTPTTSSDAHALYDLLRVLPRPAAELETTRLAREAVDEAFDGLRAFVTFLDAVQSNVALCASAGKRNEDDVVRDLAALSADLPTLIALPSLLSAYGSGACSVAAMLGLSEDDYRKLCLSGFSRAEECADAVGLRVLEALRADTTCTNSGVVTQWLEMELAGSD